MGMFGPADVSPPLFEAVSRIRAEYRDLPGLNLSARQEQRMWSVDATTCAIALDVLIAAECLSRTADGRYVLTAPGPPERQPAGNAVQVSVSTTAGRDRCVPSVRVYVGGPPAAPSPIHRFRSPRCLLIVAPFMLGYSGIPLTLTKDVVIGIVFVAGSFWIITSFSAEVGAATFQTLCSAWLVISRLLLGFDPWPRAMVNDVVVGIGTLMTNRVTLWTAARLRIKTM